MRCCGSLCRIKASYKVVLSSDQTAILDGCPMFSPAYMGRTRRGAAIFERFCYAEKLRCRTQESLPKE